MRIKFLFLTALFACDFSFAQVTSGELEQAKSRIRSEQVRSKNLAMCNKAYKHVPRENRQSDTFCEVDYVSGSAVAGIGFIPDPDGPIEFIFSNDTSICLVSLSGHIDVNRLDRSRAYSFEGCTRQ